MNIDLKKSAKPVNYKKAIDFLENRVKDLNKGKGKELVWLLEHPSIFTAGKSYDINHIIDNSIKLIETSRGGKITWHGPGQLVCYFAIDLNKRGKDIRKFINIIENSLIDTLSFYNIKSKSDRKNIGIWVDSQKETKKIAAIGIRVKKWVAYHGFSLNINNDLNEYKRIIPCGIKDKKVTNLIEIENQDYSNIREVVIENLFKYLKN
jgi:lipoyl(octanoyl) transferase|tara:strand:- start:3008 stop:3628 length:621 start_codon:yes stop_codon:yes gene_type:complete